MRLTLPWNAPCGVVTPVVKGAGIKRAVKVNKIKMGHGMKLKLEGKKYSVPEYTVTFSSLVYSVVIVCFAVKFP